MTWQDYDNIASLSQAGPHRLFCATMPRLTHLFVPVNSHRKLRHLAAVYVLFISVFDRLSPPRHARLLQADWLHPAAAPEPVPSCAGELVAPYACCCCTNSRTHVSLGRPRRCKAELPRCAVPPTLIPLQCQCDSYNCRPVVHLSTLTQQSAPESAISREESVHRRGHPCPLRGAAAAQSEHKPCHARALPPRV